MLAALAVLCKALYGSSNDVIVAIASQIPMTNKTLRHDNIGYMHDFGVIIVQI